MSFHCTTEPHYVNFNDAAASTTVFSNQATFAARLSFASPTRKSLRILKNG